LDGNDFLQSFPPLQDSLAGNFSAVAPKQIEKKIDDRSSWPLLPLLEQL
jgi:hypothetical protein